MKVLLTGATGFVGHEVARQLAADGHSLRLLVRHPHSPRAAQVAAKCGGQLLAGDIGDPASLAVACLGAEAVVHLVGIISEFGSATFERIHTEGTRNLVAAAERGDVKRFIHMSALGTRLGAPSRYHQTKWAAEQVVRSGKFAWTLFRPSLIYGAEDHFVNLFAKIIRVSPVLPVMGSGRAKFQPISVKVVALAFSRALSCEKSAGRTFDLGGPDMLTMVEIVDAIQRVTGHRRLKFHIPLGLARPQAAFLEWAYPHLFGKASPLNRDQLLMLQEGNVGDSAPANELFQLPQPAFHQGIAEYLA